MTTTNNIVAVDMGGKSIKAAHLTCVNNVTKSETLMIDDGLRSIESLMTWKNDCERVFGSLARNYLPRYVNSSINTVNDLICKKYDENLSKLHYPFKVVKVVDNHFGINFQYRTNNDKVENRSMSVEEVFYCYLDHLKKIIEKINLTTKHARYVFSIPSYFTTQQIALLKEVTKSVEFDVCDKYGYVNDYMGYSTLFGLQCNIQNDDEDENVKRNVIFVNMGEIGTSVACVSYKNKECSILSNSCDGNIGGRNINKWLIDDIKDELKSNGIEIMNDDAKTEYKLLTIIEDMKKKLSVEKTNEVNINLEEVLLNNNNNNNCNMRYDVVKLNILLEKRKVFDRIKSLINNCINESKWSEDDINNIEICILGGSMRIKYIKEKLIEFLKNITTNKVSDLTTTLNMDECISEGISYYTSIMEHTKKCHKPKCTNKLHYYIEDLSSFKHMDDSNDGIIKNDIEKIMINVMKYDERDVIENEKSLKKHLIEETQYNAIHLLEEKKLYKCEYKDYINNIKQYFGYILTWMENNNLNEIDYNELKNISDDEVIHYKILKGIYDNKMKRIQLNLYYITNSMFDRDISMIIMNEIKRSDIRNFKSKTFIENIKRNYKEQINSRLNYKIHELVGISEVAYNSIYGILMNNLDKLIDEFIPEHIKLPTLFSDKLYYTSLTCRNYHYDNLKDFVISYRLILRLNDFTNPSLNDYLKILNEITGENIMNKENLSHYSLPNKYSKSLLKEYLRDLKSDIPNKKSLYERCMIYLMNFLRLFGFAFNNQFHQPNPEKQELLLHEDE